jgi:hypothetical protein
MKKILIIIVVASFMGCAARKQCMNGKAAIDSVAKLEALSAKLFRIYTIKK